MKQDIENEKHTFEVERGDKEIVESSTWRGNREVEQSTLRPRECKGTPKGYVEEGVAAMEKVPTRVLLLKSSKITVQGES